MLSQCQQGSQCLEGASEVFQHVVPSEAEASVDTKSSNTYGIRVIQYGHVAKNELQHWHKHMKL